MKRLRNVAVALLLALVMVVTVFSTAFAANAKSGSVRVGVGKGDITGPVTDISTGYNSLGDLMKGLLTRLNAPERAREARPHPVQREEHHARCHPLPFLDVQHVLVCAL